MVAVLVVMALTVSVFPLGEFIPLGEWTFFQMTEGALIKVDPQGDEDYTRIQWAIDNASSNDVIYIHTGLYQEELEISGKNLKIIGNGTQDTIIQGDGTDPCLIISSSNNFIRGITFTTGTAGLTISGSSGNQVENCSFSNNLENGIFMENSQAALIENVTASNNGIGITAESSDNCTMGNISIQGNGFTGLYLLDSDHMDLYMNSYDNNGNSGLYLEDSENCMIRNSTFGSNHGSALLMDSCGSILVSNSTFTRHDLGGMIISSTTDAYLHYNNMTQCGVILEGGMLEHWNTHVIADSNTVNGNSLFYLKDDFGTTVDGTRGQVIMANCQNNLVQDLNISNANTAIQVGFSTGTDVNNNTLTHNSLSGVNLSHSDNTTAQYNICNSDNTAGITIYSSQDIMLYRNNCTSNKETGISLIDSEDNTAYQNNCSGNGLKGIGLSYSTSISLELNNVTEGGVSLLGDAVEFWNSHTITDTNTIGNGKPVRYLKDTVGGNVPQNPGQIILANCQGVQVVNHFLEDSGPGILLGFSDQNVVDNNTCENNNHGIEVVHSDSNLVANNTCESNYNGIYLLNSDENILYNNSCNQNSFKGIRLFLSDRNHIMNSTCNGNTNGGINLTYSDRNIISNCTANNNPSDDGVGFFVSNNNTVENCSLSNNGRIGWLNPVSCGFMCMHSSDNLIIDNNVTANDHFGIDVEGNSYRNRVEKNLVQDNTQGVGILLLNGPKHNILINNTAVNNFQNIYLWRAEENTVVSNHAYSAVHFGIILYIQCSNNIIEGNYLHSNPSSGILLYDAHSNQITNNTCNSNTEKGIELWLGSSHNEFSFNILRNNTGHGFEILEGGGHNNTIHRNAFAGNNGSGIQAFDAGADNIWYDSDTNIGNFWTDHPNRYPQAAKQGFIWDTPYKIDWPQAVYDQYPLNRPYYDHTPLVMHTDYTPSEGTTGDPFNFTGFFEDNIWILHINLTYTYNNVQFFTLQMNRTDANEFWFSNITLETDAEQLQYELEVVDVNGNSITTPLRNVMIIDNDKPELLNDDSPAEVPTGNSFTFAANFTDNILVDTVNVSYSFDGQNTFTHSMIYAGGDLWTKDISAESEYQGLDYYFTFSDTVGNVNTTDPEPIDFNDVILPSLVEDLTNIKATTGDTFVFRALIEDNWDMDRAEVEYSFDNITYQNANLVKMMNGTYRAIIQVPSNGTRLYYYFEMQDMEGNINWTYLKIIPIVDNDEPLLVMDLSDTEGSTGEPFTFTGIFQDNIEISEVRVNYTFDGVNFHNISLDPYHIDGPTVGFQKSITMDHPASYMEYIIWILDSAGNSNETFVEFMTISDVISPNADAGENITLEQGDTAIFNGSKSFDNIDVDELFWTFTYMGVHRELTGFAPSFTFEEAGSYEVTLNVTDSSGNWAAAKVWVFVKDSTPPVAKAGFDLLLLPGETAVFNASASTDNIEIADYRWSFNYSGQLIELYGMEANFTFDIIGVYNVTLTVTDSSSNTATDKLVVRVYWEDEDDPTARAGEDAVITIGDTFTLDGSGSFDDLDIISFTWSFEINGTEVILHGAKVNYTFLVTGEFEIQLEVEDPVGNTDTDSVIIKVKLEGEPGDDDDDDSDDDTTGDDDTAGDDDDGDKGSKGDDGNSWLWLIILIAVLMVIGIILLIVIRKKGGNDKEADEVQDGDGIGNLPVSTDQSVETGEPASAEEGMYPSDQASIQESFIGPGIPTETVQKGPKEEGQYYQYPQEAVQPDMERETLYLDAYPADHSEPYPEQMQGLGPIQEGELSEVAAGQVQQKSEAEALSKPARKSPPPPPGKAKPPAPPTKNMSEDALDSKDAVGVNDEIQPGTAEDSVFDAERTNEDSVEEEDGNAEDQELEEGSDETDSDEFRNIETEDAEHPNTEDDDEVNLDEDDLDDLLDGIMDDI